MNNAAHFAFQHPLAFFTLKISNVHTLAVTIKNSILFKQYIGFRFPQGASVNESCINVGLASEIETLCETAKLATELSKLVLTATVSRLL